MGRRCFAKKAILFLYWRWYNSCKGSYYTCFMAGRFVLLVDYTISLRCMV